MDEDAVRSYVDHAQATIEAAPQMDEANTKAAVLRDFLDLLDWKIPDNTQLEYSVKAFGKTYKVDYALILEGTPVAFLEAKGVDTSLTETHREQLSAYLKNEDVNLGILTNGEDYEFYRREVIDSKVNVNTLKKTDLQNLSDNITILSAFTKSAIQNEEWVTILDRIRQLREARKTLEVEKDELATEITDLFTERVSEAIASPAESQSKEMIDRLIQDIDSEIDDDVGAETLNPRSSPKPIADREESDSDTSYRVQFVDEETVLAEFDDTQQVNVFLDAVDYLLRDHALVSKLEPLPYVPGRTRPIIHDQTDWDGKEMKQPRKLTDGHYLETNLSSGQKQRELDRLVERCGFTVKFDGPW